MPPKRLSDKNERIKRPSCSSKSSESTKQYLEYWSPKERVTASEDSPSGFFIEIHGFKELFASSRSRFVKPLILAMTRTVVGGFELEFSMLRSEEAMGAGFEQERRD